MQKKTKITVSDTVKHPIKKARQKVRAQTSTVSTREVRRARLQYYLRLYIFVAGIIFLLLAAFAHIFPYFPVDLWTTHFIQQIQNSWFLFLMTVVSYPGYAPQSIILVIIIGILLFLLGLRWESIVAITTAFTSTLVNLAIKTFIGRPRPSIDLVHVMKHLTENSFPSGHVVFYVTFFGYLWFLVFTLLKQSLWRTLLLVFFSFFILLIGISRVYLGEHWASDVTGAYLLGSIWLIITTSIYQWGKKRFFVKQPVASEKK